MYGSFRGRVGVALWLVVAAASGPSVAGADEKPGDARLEFGPTAVWSIEFEVSAEEFAAMQPAAPAFGGGAGFGGPPAPQAPPAGREVERNLFGTAFPWVGATFKANGGEAVKASLRYAGDITYLVSAAGPKRPMTVRFGEEGSGGLRSLQLHAMPLDPAKAREALAGAVFRDLGVPCPRTAFAEVTLRVAGQAQPMRLGLYTVVEGVDGRFFADRFGSADGLLMKPFGLRGIDAFGDDWGAYPGFYRPQRDATADEAQRVIAFAKLVNEAGDEEFRERIGEFVEVDQFLRFLAANALTANLEGFFALGHNYHLYLDPKTDRFVFLPGDLEFSFANFLLMGSADELMELSLTKPYPGENKLIDRLMAMSGVKERYFALVKELTGAAFSKERLLRDVEAIETATKAAREREPGVAGGFGGPGAPQGPQPPDLRTFAEKRTASVEAQLAGTSTGFVPRPFSFGPPGGGFGGPREGESTAIDEETFRESVTVPERFEAMLYAGPPEVHYPVAIAAAPTGEVFVAVDEQGSLGRTPGGGKVMRCVDEDGDGKVDRVTEFAKVEHPRGVCYRDGSVWVMHPPTLSVFRDEDGDGVAEVSKTLVTGLSTELVDTRGGDHATNCVRMGIDGWLYIGVGDYGIERAVGTDGSAVTLRGGGVVRVRPDGTELEIYCTGLRNPFDLAIDPRLNLFTRDNTNDGGGWDTRVSHLVQGAEYGYPRLFANFTDEIMPPLGTFGGGGGTGGLFVDDPTWPESHRTLLTGDWGRSEVYRHELTPDGPTFALKQEVFLGLPRATGMDVDASGRLYVASWYQGEASVYVGPNVGFVARVTPKGLKPEVFPELKSLETAELIGLIGGPGAVRRLHAQGEVLRRGRDAGMTRALVALASDGDALLEGRIAALFTLKQLDGEESHAALTSLNGDAAVREFALRALADRKSERGGIDVGAFVAALGDESPRVRMQALIGLGRLGDASVVERVIPLTSLPEGTESRRPHQNDPDPGRVVPHLAVRTLVALDAGEACAAALDGPHWRGALRALRLMHDERVVDRLIEKLAGDLPPEVRDGVLVTLIRLYQREADYDGSWWGIRPDSSGPYFDRVEWEASPRIAEALAAAALGEGSREREIAAELRRHGMSLPGLADQATEARAEQTAIVLPKADPNDPNQIGSMPPEEATRRTLAATGDAMRGAGLFKSQSCVACHTTANGQAPKGPHLADIGKRYKPAELAESILSPSEKIAQGYEAYSFVTTDGLVLTGFVVREKADATVIRESNGVERELKRGEIEARERQTLSAMPQGLANNLTPEQLADLIAYLGTLN